ncbi:hypothetical protein GQ53DRAFT_773545 [Thozetella sp. PMI_491]|nr:hypothetical protein GQ53DRAFT_773545 [Thozetella sp. PMI_491]
MNALLSPTQWQRDRDENAECQSPLEASSNRNLNSRKRQREDDATQDGRSGSFALEPWIAGSYTVRLTHLKTEHDVARRCTKCWAYLPKGGPTQHQQLWYDLARLLVEELRELPLEEVATRITPWYDDPTPFFMPIRSPRYANQLTQQLTAESLPTSNASTSSSSYNSTFEMVVSSNQSAFRQQLSSELETGTEPANEPPPFNIEEAHQQLKQSWHTSTDPEMPDFDSLWDICLGLDMGGEPSVPTTGVAIAKEQSSTTRTSAPSADLHSETLKSLAEELISMRTMETIQRVPELIPRVERAFGLVSLTRIWNPKNRSGDAKLYDEVLDSLAKELISMLKMEEIQQILQLISQIERAIVLVSKIWSPRSLSAASS